MSLNLGSSIVPFTNHRLLRFSTNIWVTHHGPCSVAPGHYLVLVLIWLTNLSSGLISHRRARLTRLLILHPMTTCVLTQYPAARSGYSSVQVTGASIPRSRMLACLPVSPVLIGLAVSLPTVADCQGLPSPPTGSRRRSCSPESGGTHAVDRMLRLSSLTEFTSQPANSSSSVPS